MQERKMVRVEDAVPHTVRKSLDAMGPCLIGISLDNPAFTEHGLRETVRWAIERCESVHVVVCDTLNRHNTLLADQPEEVFMEECRIRSDAFCAFLAREFGDQIRVSRWDDLEFAEEQAAVYDQIATSALFEKSIRDGAGQFAARAVRSGRAEQEAYPAIVKASMEYLLEEMGLMEMLCRKGVRVVVYPGTQLPILKKMSTGEIPVPGLCMSQLAYIDLSIKNPH